MRKTLLLFAALICAFANNCTASDRPNIVLFYVDDLGWTDSKYMGSDFYETPHFDRIANDGMVFTNAYSNAPNCAPSRACLMTGLYSPRHGIYTVDNPNRGNPKFRKLIASPNKTTLDRSFRTIPQDLKTAGYQTAHIGKWHLSEDPLEYGFDFNIGGNRSGSPKGGYFAPYKNPNLKNRSDGEYLTDRLSEEAVQLIEKFAAKPFFLYFAHYAVHTPIQSKVEVTKHFKAKPTGKHHSDARYAAMVKSMDESLGQVLGKLDELNLSKNTILIFYSDNGGYGPATSMHPLRGSKGMMYEGGIRVPMVVRWPGRVKAKSTCDTPVIGIDIYPTLLEIAKTDIGERKLDGMSIMPLLDQKGSFDRESIYWHFPAYLQRYHGINGPFRTTPVSAIRHGKFKLLEFFENGKLELYNLEADLSESNDLSEKLPTVTRRLHKKMKAWRKSVKAPVPIQPNPKYDPKAVWRNPRKLGSQ